MGYFKLWCGTYFHAVLTLILPVSAYLRVLDLLGWKKTKHRRDGSRVHMTFEHGEYMLEHRFRIVNSYDEE